MEFTKEKAIKITHKIYHDYYDGNPDTWFSYLADNSVYIDNGNQFFLGGQAIKDHFKSYAGRKEEVISDEYYSLVLNDNSIVVYGQIAIKDMDNNFCAVTRFTCIYKMSKSDKIELIHQQNSFEFIQSVDFMAKSTIKADINTFDFVRSLLVSVPFGDRLPFHCAGQTLFLNYNLILYIESRGHNTELFCVDRTISCVDSITALSEMLPNTFYPLRRGCLINLRYITAVRHSEVELISGIKISVPVRNYPKVKQELQEFFSKSAELRIKGTV